MNDIYALILGFAMVSALCIVLVLVTTFVFVLSAVIGVKIIEYFFSGEFAEQRLERRENRRGIMQSWRLKGSPHG